MAKAGGGRIAGALLLALVLVTGLGWWFRDSLPFLRQRDATEVSPEAAAVAEEKLGRLRDDREAVSLNSIELSSLLRYRNPGWADDVLQEPSVELSGDTVRLHGKVATARLPSHPELDRVRGLLPDSAQVDVAGGLTSSRDGRAVLDVRSVEFAGIPIPSRYYPSILEGLGRRTEPGQSPSSMSLPLPPGAETARVENGRLLLTP